MTHPMPTNRPPAAWKFYGGATLIIGGLSCLVWAVFVFDWAMWIFYAAMFILFLMFLEHARVTWHHKPRPFRLRDWW